MSFCVVFSEFSGKTSMYFSNTTCMTEINSTVENWIYVEKCTVMFIVFLLPLEAGSQWTRYFASFFW